jgi:undecaprenyl-diphosphatase
LALRLWHSAIALALAVVLTQLVVAVLKELVERPRPPANDAVTDAGGFSFPSGHSATSAALFGVLALVAARHLEGGARRAAAALGVALIAAVGVSRILLGAHYPTDVLAGWLTGGTLALGSVALLTWLRRTLRRNPVSA